MYTYYSGEEHLFRMILMIYFFILIAGMAFGIARYILKSIGMYRMARNRNKDNAWLAWIPYARTYLQGELSGAISIGRQKIKNPGLWMLLIPLASGFFLILLEVIAIFSMIAYGMQRVSRIPSLFNGVFIILLVLAGLLAAAAGIVIKILKVFVDRQIYEALTGESMALFHAVASAFVPLYEDICFFVLRDKGHSPEYDYTQKYSQNPYQGSNGYTLPNAPQGTSQNVQQAEKPEAEKPEAEKPEE